MKHSDVLNGIENCALIWVEKGRTFRNLDEQEAAAARIKQAFERAPLPLAEIPGIKDTNATRQSKLLCYEASLYAAEFA